MLEPATIAALLRELATYYELAADRARAAAYGRAVPAVEGAAGGLHRLIDEGRLEELPGIGPSLARTITELARGGTTANLEKLRGQWPAVVVELAGLPKVGVVKARKIFQAFTPADLEAVAELCQAGAIRELPGLGKLSEQKILEAIAERRRNGARQILIDAEEHAAALAAHLRGAPAAARALPCGPARRCCEIVDRLALAVAADDPAAIAARLASFPLIAAVDGAAQGGPITGAMTGGMRVEIHVAPAARFGWAELAATGSAEHVAQLWGRAAARGVDPATAAAPDEAAAYAALGLPWIPPELRDGTDELAAAEAGDRFADLIALGDLTTAFHCHTTHSDGKHTIAEMARAAAELGYGAVTITDHSAAATYAHGLDAARLREQLAEIAALGGAGGGELAGAARILRGTEADILEDGAIDVPAELLPELDVVIASVHQRHGLDVEAATARIIAAMRQPYFKIWGHALGRLVLRRDPIAVRVDDVLDSIAGSPAAIEINGDPHRLDLEPALARRAAARGIKFVLSCDAHSAGALAMTRYAVAMARRARLRKRDVLNALPVDELAAAIRPLGPR